VDLALSILDRDCRKVFDQSAGVYNIRPGDRWKFTGGPTLYLPYKQGQTIRVEQIIAVTQ